MPQTELRWIKVRADHIAPGPTYRDPSQLQHQRKAECSQRIARAFHLLSLFMLLIGMVSVYWRLITCQPPHLRPDGVR